VSSAPAVAQNLPDGDQHDRAPARGSETVLVHGILHIL